jgi:3-oxoacyl-[acyl-carrier protein] reductase
MIIPEYKAHESNVVIIGGNSGIGKALATSLLNIGSSVICIDIQESCIVHKNDRLEYFQSDPLSLPDLEKVVESISKKRRYITGLVCLSGAIVNFKKMEELTYEEWLKEYDISFKSCFNACKAFMTLLKNSEKASVVNMSSGLAFGGQLNYGAYTTAKASIISFSKTLAVELAPTVRVNTLAPGAVDTPFIYRKDGSTRFDKDQYKSVVPLGVLGSAEEMAHAIVFLLSEGAKHITGQCIHVNGGAMMI